MHRLWDNGPLGTGPLLLYLPAPLPCAAHVCFMLHLFQWHFCRNSKVLLLIENYTWTAVCLFLICQISWATPPMFPHSPWQQQKYLRGCKYPCFGITDLWDRIHVGSHLNHQSAVFRMSVLILMMHGFKSVSLISIGWLCDIPFLQLIWVYCDSLCVVKVLIDTGKFISHQITSAVWER